MVGVKIALLWGGGGGGEEVRWGLRFECVQQSKKNPRFVLPSKSSCIAITKDGIRSQSLEPNVPLLAVQCIEKLGTQR